MKFPRRNSWFVLLQLFAFLPGAVASDLTLEQIVERGTESAGGKAAIEAVKSIRISLTIEEPTFKVEGVYVADRRRRMRIDIYSDQKRLYTEAFDGKGGWQLGSEGPATDSTPEGTAALWHGIIYPGKLYGLHEQAGIGNHLELVGRETLDGVNYHVLELRLKDGFEVQYYVHPESFRIERSRDVRAMHPDQDPTKKATENRYSDFRKVDGVIRAFKSIEVDLRTGAVLQTNTISEIKTNPVLDESQFRKPGGNRPAGPPAVETRP